jgi:pimeloyl-ACP methyl ester carboxylesterase
VTELPPGIRARRVRTSRVTLNVLDDGRAEGEPVLFVHGNVSSAAFFATTLPALPAGVRGLAVDLRGFGDSDAEPVDATRGVADWAEDVVALLDELRLDRVHLVGWSLGGGVAMRVLLDAPARLATLTLIAPVSPYGYGGTADLDGRLLTPDGAGTGGASVNADFVARLAAGDTSADAPTSPRRVLRAHYVKPPFVPADEDLYVASMIATRTGDDFYPGTARPSAHWPGAAAGDRGVLNTLAPVHLRLDGIADVDPKPPILWLRGEADVIVSDNSVYDLAHLGSLGAVPGWPGPQEVPPQPMVAQTRAVLERYAGNGGSFTEVVVRDAGHAPHLEQPEQVLHALSAHLLR